MCRPLKRLRVFPVGLRDHSGDFFWSEEGTPFLPWRSCIGHVDTARGRGDHAGCWGALLTWWVNSRAGNDLPRKTGTGGLRGIFLEREERYRKGGEDSFHGGRDRDSELGGKRSYTDLGGRENTGSWVSTAWEAQVWPTWISLFWIFFIFLLYYCCDFVTVDSGHIPWSFVWAWTVSVAAFL